MKGWKPGSAFLVLFLAAQAFGQGCPPPTNIPVGEVAAGVLSGASPFGFMLGRMITNGTTIDMLINALEQKGVDYVGVREGTQRIVLGVTDLNQESTSFCLLLRALNCLAGPGDEVILPAFILAPHLPELNRLYRQ